MMSDDPVGVADDDDDVDDDYKKMDEEEQQPRWQKKVERAKLKGRSELTLNGWHRDNMAQLFHVDMRVIPTDVDVIDIDNVSNSEFIDRFEVHNIPCLIHGATKNWLAEKEWNIERLSELVGDRHFKCGEDDDGYPVRLRLCYFLDYIKVQEDDSPLYIFDSTFPERANVLLTHYEVPKYFRDDIFQYVGEERRPPYRWFVFGPKRSGTSIHIDPLGTSAWNALISGYKWWCLFPPATPKALVKPHLPDSEAISWFRHVYPLTQKESWPKEYKIRQILQGPGTTVFVPSGWHHVVINVTDTIAVTQNFVSKTNFPVVWRKTVRGRPKMSLKWLLGLPASFQATAAGIDTTKDDGMPDSSSSSSSSSSSEDEDMAEGGINEGDHECCSDASLSRKRLISIGSATSAAAITTEMTNKKLRDILLS